MNNNIINKEYHKFFSDLKERVTSSRYKAALSVNRELIMLYHHIGMQILDAQSKQGWGAKVIEQLSKDLASEFPEMKGFSVRNLKYMRKFAAEYPDIQFVQEVLAQLTWYHNVTLLDKISDKQIRLFYVKHAIEHGWSRNILAEYTLRDMTKPIGLAEYRLTESLPENIQTLLPTIEELEAELAKDLGGEDE
jgi:predicted nuclease of restriction endonuclease-like (RecB) superfamily